MAKIDDIAELLLNEFEQFQKTTKNLTNKMESFKNTKTALDTSDISNMLTKYYIKIEQLTTIIKGSHNQKSTNKYSFAKMEFYSLVFFALITIFSLTYSNHVIKQTEKIKKTAYNNGKSDIKLHIQKFFIDNPKTAKTYDSWIEKQK